jgi:competence protein ComEC
LNGRGPGPRSVGLSGLVAGIGLSAPLGLGPPPVFVVVAAVAVAAFAWRPGAGGAQLLRGAVLGTAAALAGLWIGAARLAAIDGAALRAETGAELAVRGFVEAVPRRAHGEVRVRVATADGRLLVEAPEPAPDLPVGGEVTARGSAREPDDWERPYLERQGVATVLEARSIRPTEARRGGLAYLTDRLRERAEQALVRGTPEPQSALLRGFVLGQDDRIDPRTVDEFQRSGLAHLLAVSGQNVVLLAVLAMPVLAAAGLGIRGRLLGVLALIAVYVPVAGAGPSIQRAGVMGAAGVVAALASRPASRWYAMLLAAAFTLVLNPRAPGDVGWQLSFAAVIGIALWTAPLRRLLAGEAPRTGARRALAEGVAVTVAATVATAPLMAHHFERLSLASLLANLLALPAVAPVMWLGMLAAAAGQLPWMPVEPLTGLAGLLAAYIEQIAASTAAPRWAEVSLWLESPWAVAGVYVAIASLGWALERRAGALRRLRPRPPWAATVAALATLAGLLFLAGSGAGDTPQRTAGLTVRILDVGQGDAILLTPRRGDPVLVDTGPAGGGVAERLTDLGVERLAAVLITHDESDHAGGLAEVLDAIRVDELLWGAPDRGLAAAAAAHGAMGERVGQGSALSSGALRLDVLWPPSALIQGPHRARGADPNHLSVVAVARWRDFRILLTGDGEAEAVPLDPGPVDVLKLAHHGSADAGLEGLVERTSPSLAVASVGAQNPFGHPAATTLDELAERDVPLLRTDTAGEITIAVDHDAWTVLGET